MRNFTSHRPQWTCGCRSYDPVWCSHVFLVQQTEIIRVNPKHTLYIKAGHHDITNWLMTSCYGISSWLSPFCCFELSLLYPNFPNYPKTTDNLFKQVFHICETERFPKTKYNINKYKRLILLPKSDQTVTEKYWSNKTIQNHIGSQHLCSISTCFSSLPGLPETCTCSSLDAAAVLL